MDDGALGVSCHQPLEPGLGAGVVGGFVDAGDDAVLHGEAAVDRHGGEVPPVAGVRAVEVEHGDVGARAGPEAAEVRAVQGVGAGHCCGIVVVLAAHGQRRAGHDAGEDHASLHVQYEIGRAVVMPLRWPTNKRAVISTAPFGRGRACGRVMAWPYSGMHITSAPPWVARKKGRVFFF